MSKLIGGLLVVLAFGWAVNASAIPITDTVIVDGIEWAQPDDFTSLSWNQMNEVCPAGVCVSGTLNGYDMAGWTWGGIDDLNGLFNFYLQAAGVSGDDLLSGPDNFQQASSTWAPAFFTDFRSTWVYDFGYYADGRTRERSTFSAGYGYYASLWDQTNFDDSVQTLGTTGVDETDELVGGWFFRPEQIAPVPTPTTIPLLGLGLAALGYSRLQRKQHI